MNDFFETNDQKENDLNLLQSLTDSDKLTTPEREAFERMVEDLGRRSQTALSPAQRRWALNVQAQIKANTGHIVLLRNVLDATGLRDSERDAFLDMLSDLQTSRRTLSKAQHDWVSAVAERECVDSAQNLYSACKVPQGFERKEKLLPFEQPGYEKPLKPPGRK